LSHAHASRARGRLGLAMVLGLICALGLTLLPGVASAAGKGKKVGHTLTAMSRNLYLGADLSPALEATSVNAAIDAGGQINNQVHATQFPTVRARLLAQEIRKVLPDVIGIQEGAWWRMATPASLTPALTGTPVASQTDPAGGDFLTDLVNQINAIKGGKAKGKKSAGAAKKKAATPKYRLAASNNEFDFELPVNNGSGGLAAADHNERLTMRDAIIVQKGVKVSNVTSGHFNVLLQVKLANTLPVNVTRGWVAADVKVHGRTFHVVNTHFEAFDSNASNTGSDGNTYPKGGIREAQAKQLVAPGGPATSRFPTILIGDLNSDVPVHGDQVFPGDALAYQAVLNGGFLEKSPAVPPFGCCVADSNLVNPSTANVTHRVDHIMSNSNKVKFKKGGITSTYSGLWSSDHFGLWSQLLIK
jgi:endonuclease/exonuclease/phosphatase family metal-dependent hydrolase